MAGLTHQQRRDKADRTTGAAADIIRREREASDAKSARLKAMREEREQAAIATKSESAVKLKAKA